jgi:hypothetical protein
MGSLDFMSDPASLKYAAGLQAIGAQLQAGKVNSLEKLAASIQKQLKYEPKALASRADFNGERARVDNSLVALKLASDGTLRGWATWPGYMSWWAWQRRRSAA